MASITGVVATPMKLSTDTEMIGPAMTRSRGTPSVGEPSEADLRHGGRHLKAHRQQSRREERQAELRNEERQQRGVDVPVAIDHDVGAGHQQDGRVQFEARHVSGGPDGE